MKREKKIWACIVWFYKQDQIGAYDKYGMQKSK